MNTQLAQELISELLIPGSISGVEFLDKGYSSDQKYVLLSDGAPRYLLRVSDISEEQRRRADYDAVSQLWDKGIACPEPIAFGVSAKHGVCFIVQGYIPGECAEDSLPKLRAEQQYEVGLQAGRKQRRIHLALEPTCAVDNFAVMSRKLADRKRQFHELGIVFENWERVIGYADTNLHLLRDRPTTFRHGDYHPGNLILQDGRLSGVIDFNRCDWGDPVDEFYKTAFFGAPLSREYARGQVRGYFDGDPPDDFWPLYNLYLAIALPGDVIWTHRNYPQDLARSIDLIELITRTHDFDAGGPPSWWLGDL